MVGIVAKPGVLLSCSSLGILHLSSCEFVCPIDFQSRVARNLFLSGTRNTNISQCLLTFKCYFKGFKIQSVICILNKNICGLHWLMN